MDARHATASEEDGRSAIALLKGRDSGAVRAQEPGGEKSDRGIVDVRTSQAQRETSAAHAAQSNISDADFITSARANN
jgi:hypothetical protein